MRRIALVLVCISASLAYASLAAAADDYSSATYTVSTPTLSSGGLATSTNFNLIGVISQFATGSSSASTFTFGLHAGFPFYPFVSTPVVTATAGDASVALSWTSASGSLGWNPSGYSVGQSTASGGPYSYTSVGNVLSATQSSLTNGTPYYFVIRVLDAFSAGIATSSQVSATPVAAASNTNTTTSGSSGGGGGAIASPTTSGATVSLSGRAYPGSTVTILKDAQIVTSAPADSHALFSTSVTGLSGGNYQFSIYSQDSAGHRSTIRSFPVTVAANATVTVTGIFLAPTIDVDKSKVRQGDNIVIFGASAPDSIITINVHSDSNLFVTAASDAHGAYLYTLDTSPLALGSHNAKSKAAVSGEISGFGAAVGFDVGTENVEKPKETKAVGDQNADSRVNLVDFSVMAYWYKRPLTGTGVNADLNHDGKVDLVDFSILVSHWTG
ncbi:MAG: hypothetical protein Q7S95_00085 [bacterium]|nr:hypothetical protein [bacterium]